MTADSAHTRCRGAWLAAAALLMGLAFGLPARGAEGDPDWLPVLKLQLKESYNCDFSHLVFSREVPLAGFVTVEGRVRCIDDREYDFTRSSPHKKFDLKACQPTVC